MDENNPSRARKCIYFSGYHTSVADCRKIVYGIYRRRWVSQPNVRSHHDSARSISEVANWAGKRINT